MELAVRILATGIPCSVMMSKTWMRIMAQEEYSGGGLPSFRA